MIKLKVLFIFLYILIIIVPIAYFVNLDNLLTKYNLVRILGIYGILFLFTQIITGSLMNIFIKIFGPKVLKLHIINGVITYLIILFHPILFFSDLFSQDILKVLKDFPIEFKILLSLGTLAFLLLTIGVFAGIFRTKPFITRRWRLFHRFNYLVFFLVIIHSYFIGSDTKTAPFIYLYPIFIVGLIVSVVYKIKFKTQKSKIKS